MNWTARLPKPEQPIFLIVAGPNGSGKSTAYEDTAYELEGRTLWIVNPDLLTARVREVEKLSQQQANLAAVQRIERWLESSIEVHKSVGVETVLSTDKYRRLVPKAKTARLCNLAHLCRPRHARAKYRTRTLASQKGRPCRTRRQDTFTS